MRYAIGLTARQLLFPWATLSINLVGSFVLGLFLTWAVGRVSVAIVTPIAVGVLGGFTTFSTFAWEGFFLGRSGRPELALVYVFLSVAGGLVAAWFGYRLGRFIWGTAA